MQIYKLSIDAIRYLNKNVLRLCFLFRSFRSIIQFSEMEAGDGGSLNFDMFKERLIQNIFTLFFFNEIEIGVYVLWYFDTYFRQDVWLSFPSFKFWNHLQSFDICRYTIQLLLDPMSLKYFGSPWIRCHVLKRYRYIQRQREKRLKAFVKDFTKVVSIPVWISASNVHFTTTKINRTNRNGVNDIVKIRKIFVF